MSQGNDKVVFRLQAFPEIQCFHFRCRKAFDLRADLHCIDVIVSVTFAFYTLCKKCTPPVCRAMGQLTRALRSLCALSELDDACRAQARLYRLTLEDSARLYHLRTARPPCRRHSSPQSPCCLRSPCYTLTTVIDALKAFAAQFTCLESQKWSHVHE